MGEAYLYRFVGKQINSRSESGVGRVSPDDWLFLAEALVIGVPSTLALGFKRIKTGRLVHLFVSTQKTGAGDGLAKAGTLPLPSAHGSVRGQENRFMYRPDVSRRSHEIRRTRDLREGSQEPDARVHSHSAENDSGAEGRV